MPTIRIVVAMVTASLTAFGAGVASAQDYPSKTIRIVTAGVGASADVAARLVALGTTASLGQQMIVDNRGSGVVPGEIVMKSAPDGYTLLVYGGPLWIGPLIESAPYDAVRDFSPITLIVRQPNVLVVHPSLRVNNVKELIALAKARPGALNYGSLATGGSAHLAAELFNAMAGVKIVRIPYKSGAAQVTDLLGGEIQLAFATTSTVVPHIKSGRLKALAVTTAQPTALMPGMPTVAATGLPGYESEAKVGLFAPARTPDAIINRLNQEVVRTVHRPDMKDKFVDAGVEAVGSTPAEFAAAIKAEIVTLGKVIKDAGIRAD